MAEPEKQEDGVSVATWYRILAVVVILLIITIAWGVYLAAALLRGPVRQPAAAKELAPPASAAPAAAPEGDWATSAESVDKTLVVRRPTAGAEFPAPLPEPAPQLNLSLIDMANHLHQQAENLRRQCTENAGNSNGLTPSKEEAEKLINDGRVLL